MGKSGMTGQIAFFDRTMNEAIGLLGEARRYLVEKAEKERKVLPTERGLQASLETMRLVARLTQVMAWLLTHRAVHAGEMSLAEAMRPDRRLGGRELCLNTDGDNDPALPKELRSILDRSHALYERIARLDDQSAERVEQMSRVGN
jgi:regulator of CtrA degradation